MCASPLFYHKVTPHGKLGQSQLMLHELVVFIFHSIAPIMIFPHEAGEYMRIY